MGPMAKLGQGLATGAPYLLHVVASLCAGLDEHDTQLFGALLPLLDGYLPADEGRGTSVRCRAAPGEGEGTAWEEGPAQQAGGAQQDEGAQGTAATSLLLR